MSLGKFSITKLNGSADLPITDPGTFTCAEVTGLAALVALLLELRFVYGSGGVTTKVYVQTTLDDGTTWTDIACVAFATTSEVKLLNFSALTPKLSQVSPTDGALADNTALDGILGDRIRCKVVVDGTYADATVLVGRIVAR